MGFGSIHKFFLKTFILVASLSLVTFIQCDSSKPKEFVEVKLETKVPIWDLATYQYSQLLKVANKVQRPPRSVDKEGNHTFGKNWTSGFFAGSLWRLYEVTKDEKWKKEAIKFSRLVEHKKSMDHDHDVGFIIHSSFGKGYELTKDEAFKEVVITAANSFIKCYNPNFKATQSWNGNWVSRRGWDSPVIIDNLMNLELLFKATQLTGDSTYFKIACQHTETTIKHHIRRDGSTYHMVNFDSISGKVINKQTVQGFSDESAWARGQSWGLYGLTMIYRYTQNAMYLDKAEKLANFVLNHPSLTEDFIPYWDYNVWGKEQLFKDASAASIMASALFELSTYASPEQALVYRQSADKIMESLTSEEYLSKPNSNHYYLIRHSVGNFPGEGEVDVPTIYADYYFLEAYQRQQELFLKSRMSETSASN